MRTPVEVPDRSAWRFTQFGIFMSMFSEAEAMLRTALRKVVGVDHKTALAIFSGARVETGSSFIRRCYQARGKTIPVALNACLSRLSEINNYRNDLVHYMPDLHAEDEPIVTNLATAHLPENARSRPFDDDTLMTYQMDLAAIILVLSRHPKFAAPDFSPQGRERLPWLYKAPSPARKGRDTQGKTRQAARRPPKSSPA